MLKNISFRTKVVFGIMFCSLILVVTILFSYQKMIQHNSFEQPVFNVAALDTKPGEFIYLSDIDWTSARVGWGSIVKNGTSSGKISIKINGSLYSFDKGIFAHATSTIDYDLGTNHDYDWFTVYVGLNSSSSAGNGVKYYIYTAGEDKNYTLQTSEEGIYQGPGANATFLKINIKNARYLRLYANDNGANGNDHSVYADAKLVKGTPIEETVMTTEEYDRILSTKYANATLDDKEYELLLLQRKLVSNMGNYALVLMKSTSPDISNAFNWIFNDVDNLRMYIMGGTPSGNYVKSFEVLADLYKHYHNDFNITETTKYGTVLGELYKKMAITLSLTHSAKVALWMQPGAAENQSDAVTRYQIYKDLHKNGKMVATPSLDITKWFEKYSVEEMRFVLNNAIDDEEILWLNEYTQSFIDANPTRAWSYLTPHPYMAYVWPNYSNDIYYTNDDYFNDLFKVGNKKLFDYGISKGSTSYKLYKVWMNFRNKFGTGAVCGGISKTGVNIRGSHGIAATVIGQPGHAAILYYTEDANGNGYWNIDNDVSGWTLSEKGERMLLGWGNASYSRGYSVSYMALAQEALNDYENLEKAEEIIMHADSFAGNYAKQEEIYRKALEAQSFNIDAWYGLVNVYLNDPSKSENDLYNLAEEMGESLKYFPLPMYHLTNLIKPRLTSIAGSYKFTLMQTRILTEGTTTPNNTTDNYYVYQPSLTRLMANNLLGKLDKTIATFSFDGDDARKIVLSSRFDGSGVRWDYSLDGKQTWNELSFSAEEEHKVQLTTDQINSITAENDIYVHIVGVDYEEKNLYKIDITKGTLPNLYGNDLENRVVGASTTYEWRFNEYDDWKSYKNESPDLTGDKTVEVRNGATGTALASDSQTFSFTTDNQPDTRKYIPVSHLSIAAVSTQATSQGRPATNAIDGNYNTNWHSAWNGSDTERYITIKLDNPAYISAVEFVPGGGGNGKILDGIVYGSVDGENWVELSKMTNLTYTNQANTNADAIANTKSFEIADPKEVQYIKIVANRASNGNWFTARAFNLFQDLTKNPHPTAGVAYSPTEPTTGNVVARLINFSSENIVITSEGGDTHTFTENGTFVFTFRDTVTNMEGSATAIVRNIDRDKPTADIKYSTKEPTTSSVTAQLTNLNEDVYLLDSNNKRVNYVEVANKKVIYISYLDNRGNTTKTLNLDANGQTESITYYYQDIVYTVTYNSSGVISSETFQDSHGNPIDPENKEEIRQLNLIGRSKPLEYEFTENGTYTFRLQDKAGNISVVTASVNNIENIKVHPNIIYSITSPTNKNVTATVTFDQQNVIITNNNGKSSYDFSENGSFVFEYRDVNGNVGEAVATVNWIDRVIPTAEIEYDKSSKKIAIVKVVNPSEEISFDFGNGTYEINKNGRYEITFVDKAGNKGQVVAIVDWLEDSINKPNEGNNPSVPGNVPGNNPNNGNINNNQNNSSSNNNTTNNGSTNNSGNNTNSNGNKNPINNNVNSNQSGSSNNINGNNGYKDPTTNNNNNTNSNINSGNNGSTNNNSNNSNNILNQEDLTPEEELMKMEKYLKFLLAIIIVAITFGLIVLFSKKIMDNKDEENNNLDGFIYQ